MSGDEDPNWPVFKEWFRKQPQFSTKIDDIILLRFLHSCYYDLEKAQKTAETFFSTRATWTDIFVDRDPLSPEIQNAIQFCKMAHYPISENRYLWIWQIDDPGLQRFNVVHEAKLSSLVTDSWLLTYQTLEESDIMIICVKHMSFRILMKLNLALSRMQIKYYEDAVPFRMNQIHFINCPPIMNRVFSLYKTFIDPEVSKKIRFHPPDSDSLFEFISKEELPKDLGGSLETMEYYTKMTIENIMKQRDQLLDGSYWNSKDMKKP